mmetsp:Transcript_29748/g.53426  ORF Transcript_29748/g.53426 Transcript_29748/m.53426 type:complete len:228 (+) Transcript_29748:446-1129(+)
MVLLRLFGARRCPVHVPRPLCPWGVPSELRRAGRSPPGVYRPQGGERRVRAPQHDPERVASARCVSGGEAGEPARAVQHVPAAGGAHADLRGVRACPAGAHALRRRHCCRQRGVGCASEAHILRLWEASADNHPPLEGRWQKSAAVSVLQPAAAAGSVRGFSGHVRLSRGHRGGRAPNAAQQHQPGPEQSEQAGTQGEGLADRRPAGRFSCVAATLSPTRRPEHCAP